MREFIVYRHGWNEVNQNPAHGLPEKMPVARRMAEDADDACAQAAAQVSLMDGQYLTAEFADEVDAKVNNISMKVEALERSENE